MRLLIVDDEQDIVEIIEMVLRNGLSNEVEFFTSNNAKNAIDIIKNKGIDFCISDHNMPGGNGDQVLKYIIDEELKTSFISCSSVTLKNMPESYPLNSIFFHIQKPDVISGVDSLIEYIKKKKDAQCDQMFKIESEYIPVTVELMLSLTRTPSDLYIKLSGIKYLKCLNKGDSFTIDDVSKYSNKGIFKLFIKRPTDKNLFRTIVLGSMNKIMSNTSMNVEQRFCEFHSQICDLIKFMGVTEEIVQNINLNMTKASSELMKNSQVSSLWDKSPLKGPYASKLFSLQVSISSVIIKKLGWSADSSLNKLSTAALLQDIFLEDEESLKITDHDEFLKKSGSMSKAEMKRFLDHPLAANDLVLSIKSLPPGIDRLILEQHETPDGSGFPRKLDAFHLGPMSCVFIISGILAKRILENEKGFSLGSFVKEYEAKGYSKGNFKDSFKIIKEFA